MTTNLHSDAREMAEAVARWMGWKQRDGDPHLPWRNPSGMPAYRLPNFASSLDAMREVEDEIERRGLDVKYMEHLVGVLGKDRLVGEWEILRATAAQRLEAAARVIEEVSR